MNAQTKPPYTCLFLVLIQTMVSLLPYFKGYRTLKYLILRSIFIQHMEWVCYVRIVHFIHTDHHLQHQAPHLQLRNSHFGLMMRIT